MNTNAKGARCERRTMERLAELGFNSIRSSASRGVFDVIAWDGCCSRFIQVKCGTKYASMEERLAMLGTPVPPNATREIWRWPTRARAPLVEVL